MFNPISKIAKTLLSLFILSFIALSFNVTAEADKKEKSPNSKSTNPIVIMETTAGDIVIELFAEEAPITVENFLKYVDDGFYNGTIFHRVIPGFVIQGGGFTFDFQRKSNRAPIKNESDNKLQNLKGTLSMARTTDLDSATSQFFINTQNNISLNARGDAPNGYAVFGKVIKGYEAVEKIVKEPRGMHASKGYRDAPNSAVIITKAIHQEVTDPKKNKTEKKEKAGDKK